MSPRHSSAARVPPPSRDREHHPSFSAALLDAIYHSLDDADADACTTDADLIRRANVSPDERPPPPPPCGRRRSTSSSSPGSSSRSPRSQKPPRPCRVRPHPQPPSVLLPPPTPVPPGDGRDEKRKSRRKRRRTRSAPLACLLNALLCNRKPPASASSSSSPIAATATRAPLAVVRAEPASARSILSSRASRRESASAAPGGFLTPGRRAVRFSPAVEVVGDDEYHRGARPAIRLRDDMSGSGAEVAAAPRESAAEAERRVEELLRALGAAEERERERAKESSESSSDLFELDTLPAALDGGIGLPRTTAADLAPPRPRVLLDEMVV